MRPSELSALLAHTIPSGMPLLIVGASGVGKSQIVGQATQAARADLIISHPAVSDPTDAKGLPWLAPDQTSARFLPFGDLAKAMQATTRTVWFLDDLGQAPASVQASYMQLLLARRVNEHAIPPCCLVYLTDLCGEHRAQAPAMPLLWVTTEPTATAPYGDVVAMEA